MSIDGDVNIVIADDSPFIRTAYQRILETQYNFSVVAVAEDGEQAIEKVTELQPDVLVIDVRMPKLDGIEASKIIREKFPNISLVVVSGHDDVDLVLSLFEDFTGSKAYIQKNSLDDVGELIRVVELSLDGKVVLDINIVSKLISSYKIKYKDSDNILLDNELEILSLYANGFDENYISDEIQKDVEEVNKLIDNITSKFNIKKSENINLQASITLSFIASCIEK